MTLIEILVAMALTAMVASMVYGGFAAMCPHWVPTAVLAWVWLQLFLPNMLAKEKSSERRGSSSRRPPTASPSRRYRQPAVSTSRQTHAAQFS